jgi:hypothetical protein
MVADSAAVFILQRVRCLIALLLAAESATILVVE